MDDKSKKLPLKYSKTTKGIDIHHNQDINSRMTTMLNKINNQSSNEMSNLLNDIYNIGNQMRFHTIDYETINNIDHAGHAKTKKLSRTVKKSTNLIYSFCKNYGEFVDVDFYKRPTSSKLFQNYKKLSKKSTNNNFAHLQANELKNFFEGDEVKNMEKFEEFFGKYTKLEKLKGEIIMKEQKKKYSLFKKYEPEKTYTSNHFMRNKIIIKDRDQSLKIKSRYKKQIKLNENAPKKLYFGSKTLQAKEGMNTINYKTNFCPFNNYAKSKSKIINFNNANLTNNVNNTLSTIQNNSVSTTMYNANNSTNVKTTLNTEQNSALNINKKPKNSRCNVSKNRFNISQLFLTQNSHQYISTISSSYSRGMEKSNKKKKYILLTKGNQIRLKKDALKRIQDLHKKAFEKSNKLVTEIQKNEKEFDEKNNYNFYNNYINNIKKENEKVVIDDDSVNISQLNEELGFTKANKTYNNNQVNELEIVLHNAEKVKKKLDKKSKETFNGILLEMIDNDRKLNHHYYGDSKYERKLHYIKQKNDFKKVVDETIALEKGLVNYNGIEPSDERNNIMEMMFDLSKKEELSNTGMKFLIIKDRVLKSIEQKGIKKPKK